MAVRFDRVVPVLRIFSVENAREFYLDYLGFSVDFEHRFADGMPLYMQISRAGCVLHLSEHHGDGTPGTVVFVPMNGLDSFHAELAGRGDARLRPGIEEQPWNAREMTVTDPFGNRIRFTEYKTG